MLSINSLRPFLIAKPVPAFAQYTPGFCADCFVAAEGTKQFPTRETIFRLSCRRPETLAG
jgi:hypothetical protein